MGSREDTVGRVGRISGDRRTGIDTQGEKFTLGQFSLYHWLSGVLNKAPHFLTLISYK